MARGDGPRRGPRGGGSSERPPRDDRGGRKDRGPRADSTSGEAREIEDVNIGAVISNWTFDKERKVYKPFGNLKLDDGRERVFCHVEALCRHLKPGRDQAPDMSKKVYVKKLGPGKDGRGFKAEKVECHECAGVPAEPSGAGPSDTSRSGSREPARREPALPPLTLEPIPAAPTPPVRRVFAPVEIPVLPDDGTQASRDQRIAFENTSETLWTSTEAKNSFGSTEDANKFRHKFGFYVLENTLRELNPSASGAVAQQFRNRVRAQFESTFIRALRSAATTDEKIFEKIRGYFGALGKIISEQDELLKSSGINIGVIQGYVDAVEAEEQAEKEFPAIEAKHKKNVDEIEQRNREREEQRKAAEKEAADKEAEREKKRLEDEKTRIEKEKADAEEERIKKEKEAVEKEAAADAAWAAFGDAIGNPAAATKLRKRFGFEQYEKSAAADPRFAKAAEANIKQRLEAGLADEPEIVEALKGKSLVFLDLLANNPFLQNLDAAAIAKMTISKEKKETKGGEGEKKDKTKAPKVSEIDRRTSEERQKHNEQASAAWLEFETAVGSENARLIRSRLGLDTYANTLLERGLGVNAMAEAIKMADQEIRALASTEQKLPLKILLENKTAVEALLKKNPYLTGLSMGRLIMFTDRDTSFLGEAHKQEEKLKLPDLNTLPIKPEAKPLLVEAVSFYRASHYRHDFVLKLLLKAFREEEVITVEDAKKAIDPLRSDRTHAGAVATLEKFIRILPTYREVGYARAAKKIASSSNDTDFVTRHILTFLAFRPVARPIEGLRAALEKQKTSLSESIARLVTIILEDKALTIDTEPTPPPPPAPTPAPAPAPTPAPPRPAPTPAPAQPTPPRSTPGSGRTRTSRPISLVHDVSVWKTGEVHDTEHAMEIALVLLTKKIDIPPKGLTLAELQAAVGTANTITEADLQALVAKEYLKENKPGLISSLGGSKDSKWEWSGDGKTKLETYYQNKLLRKFFGFFPVSSNLPDAISKFRELSKPGAGNRAKNLANILEDIFAGRTPEVAGKQMLARIESEDKEVVQALAIHGIDIGNLIDVWPIQNDIAAIAELSKKIDELGLSVKIKHYYIALLTRTATSIVEARHNIWEKVISFGSPKKYEDLIDFERDVASDLGVAWLETPPGYANPASTTPTAVARVTPTPPRAEAAPRSPEVSGTAATMTDSPTPPEARRESPPQPPEVEKRETEALVLAAWESALAEALATFKETGDEDKTNSVFKEKFKEGIASTIGDKIDYWQSGRVLITPAIEIKNDHFFGTYHDKDHRYRAVVINTAGLNINDTLAKYLFKFQGESGFIPKQVALISHSKYEQVEGDPYAFFPEDIRQGILEGTSGNPSSGPGQEAPPTPPDDGGIDVDLEDVDDSLPEAEIIVGEPGKESEPSNTENLEQKHEAALARLREVLGNDRLYKRITEGLLTEYRYDPARKKQDMDDLTKEYLNKMWKNDDRASSAEFHLVWSAIKELLETDPYLKGLTMQHLREVFSDNYFEWNPNMLPKETAQARDRAASRAETELRRENDEVGFAIGWLFSQVDSHNTSNISKKTLLRLTSALSSDRGLKISTEMVKAYEPQLTKYFQNNPKLEGLNYPTFLALVTEAENLIAVARAAKERMDREKAQNAPAPAQHSPAVAGLLRLKEAAQKEAAASAASTTGRSGPEAKPEPTPDKEGEPTEEQTPDKKLLKEINYNDNLYEGLKEMFLQYRYKERRSLTRYGDRNASLLKDAMPTASEIEANRKAIEAYIAATPDLNGLTIDIMKRAAIGENEAQTYRNRYKAHLNAREVMWAEAKDFQDNADISKMAALLFNEFETLGRQGRTEPGSDYYLTLKEVLFYQVGWILDDRKESLENLEKARLNAELYKTQIDQFIANSPYTKYEGLTTEVASQAIEKAILVNVWDAIVDEQLESDKKSGKVSLRTAAKNEIVGLILEAFTVEKERRKITLINPTRAEEIFTKLVELQVIEQKTYGGLIKRDAWGSPDSKSSSPKSDGRSKIIDFLRKK